MFGRSHGKNSPVVGRRTFDRISYTEVISIEAREQIMSEGSPLALISIVVFGLIIIFFIVRRKPDNRGSTVATLRIAPGDLEKRLREQISRATLMSIPGEEIATYVKYCNSTGGDPGFLLESALDRITAGSTWNKELSSIPHVDASQTTSESSQRAT